MLFACPLYSRAEEETIAGETFLQHYNKGIEYYKQGKYDHAKEGFELAAEIRPSGALNSAHLKRISHTSSLCE